MEPHEITLGASFVRDVGQKAPELALGNMLEYLPGADAVEEDCSGRPIDEREWRRRIGGEKMIGVSVPFTQSATAREVSEPSIANGLVPVLQEALDESPVRRSRCRASGGRLALESKSVSLRLNRRLTLLFKMVPRGHLVICRIDGDGAVALAGDRAGSSPTG